MLVLSELRVLEHLVAYDLADRNQLNDSRSDKPRAAPTLIGFANSSTSVILPPLRTGRLKAKARQSRGWNPQAAGR